LSLFTSRGISDTGIKFDDEELELSGGADELGSDDEELDSCDDDEVCDELPSRPPVLLSAKTIIAIISKIIAITKILLNTICVRLYFFRLILRLFNLHYSCLIAELLQLFINIYCFMLSYTV